MTLTKGTPELCGGQAMRTAAQVMKLMRLFDQQTVLLACIFSTFAMTGLIWLIQLVQYPLFARVGRESFCDYEREHCHRITPLVLPLMATELASSLWLGFRPIAGLESMLMIGACLAVSLWVSTFLLQVPLHNRLCREFCEADHRRLVLSNWLRTAVWTVRSAMLLMVLGELIQVPV